MELLIHPLAYKLEVCDAFRWIRFFGIIAAAVLGFLTLEATNHLSPLINIIAANAVVIAAASAFILLPEAISALLPKTKLLAFVSTTHATLVLEKEIHIDLQSTTSINFEIPGYFTNFNWPGGRSCLRIDYGDRTECVQTKFQYRPLANFIVDVDEILKQRRK